MSSAVDLLALCVAKGIELSANEDKLRVEAAPGIITEEIKAALLLHKPELLRMLRSGCPAGQCATVSADEQEQDQALIEAIEERAAIFEYDVGLPRAEAESAAREMYRVFLYRLVDDPHACLDHDDFTERLFAERGRIQGALSSVLTKT